MKSAAWAAILVSAVATALNAGAAAEAPPSRRLRGSDALARAYDSILEARFDRSDAELDRACGSTAASAPPEACGVLRATALWWRIQLDPHNVALDGPFLDAVDRAVAAAEAWTDRSPDDAEGWFYLGGAYAARVQWRVLREERLAAARDGKRIKDALERAVALDPQLNDAYFGIGLYKYYADVAPMSAKFLRWLFLLPGGDRVEGLDGMLRAQNRGELLQGEADYQLHIIYLWYEQRPDRALALLEGLEARYPSNPLFPLQIAQVKDVYFHDAPASRATYEAVLAAAQAQKLAFPQIAETQARLGIARRLNALAEPDLAVEHLKAIVGARSDSPTGALANAQFELGSAYDRMGFRSHAVAAYTAASAVAPADDPDAVRDRASAALRRKPDARAADATRLSLEGLRRLERGDAAAASASLDRAVRLAPRDFVTRARYGRALAARRLDAKALAELDRALNAPGGAPPSLVAAAYIDAGALHERAGRRASAVEMYRAAARVFGGGAAMRAEALRALERLTP
jgi:tetratricopeptide (TPR) repeat protein